ncbi:MAG: flavodoxin domain-containing protein [Clostridia bacterium]|nr:flavodoxin domain-containing protein [Clostridia bacterium]
MKDVIVSYSSSYGHTKKYAEYIARELNCEIVDFSQTRVRDYKPYDIIVYCAPIKNNMVVDAYQFTYNFNLLKDNVQLYVFADGILKPSEELLKSIVSENFYKGDAGKVHFFYGEGGLDIDTLKWSDMLHLRYYIEEAARSKPGDRYYELAKLIGDPFDNSNMAYADALIQKVLEELDE